MNTRPQRRGLGHGFTPRMRTNPADLARRRPPEEDFRGVPATAALRPREQEDQVRYTTLVTIRALGHRVQYLREESKRLNRMLRPLIRQTQPLCSRSTGSATTQPPNSPSLQETIRSGSEPKPPGPTSAEQSGVANSKKGRTLGGSE